jgi:hypothetical protein
MNLERTRHTGLQFKHALVLPCWFAGLLLVVLLFLPARASATCTTANPNPNPNPESFAAVGDFNGDCKSDILWQNSGTGEPYFWLMNGTAIGSQSGPGTVTTDWVIQGVGDFNNDGKADILWQNSTTGEVYVWLMNGLTIASQGSPATVSPSSGWSIVGIGDFNDDGSADVLWQNDTSGEVYVWLMNGTAITSQGALANGISPNWAILGIGDFDGNGTSDVLWQNSSTGQVYIWFMNGLTIASQGSPGSPASPQSVECNPNNGCATVVGDGWSIDGVGDYDASGRAGILWRQLSSGEVYLWLMNGLTITSQASPGVITADWEISTLAPYGCSNQILCGILSGINAARVNGPFPGTAAPWGPMTGSPNPAPSSEPGGALNPLVWDAGAATVAANWAAGCSHTHNTNRDGGENMDFGEGTFTGQSVASGWDSEASNYVYPAAGGNCTASDSTGVCGHYSQDVWRTTTAVGCALQQCQGSSNPFGDGNPWWYVICDFTPAGNYPQVPY